MFKRSLVGAFILFPLFVSCGKYDFLLSDDVPFKNKTDKAFLSYIQDFESLYGKVKSPIIFANLDSRKVGLCTKYSNGYNEIKIDVNFWIRASEAAKNQLILHELGHCELNRGHDDTSINNCPKSAMRSYTFFPSELENCFIPNFDYYLEELKGR